MTYKVVYLSWVDSAELTGWRRLDTLEQEKPALITTIGFLLRKPSKDYPFYVVARDISPITESVCGIMEIPKVAVTGIQEIDIEEEE